MTGWDQLVVALGNHELHHIIYLHGMWVHVIGVVLYFKFFYEYTIDGEEIFFGGIAFTFGIALWPLTWCLVIVFLGVKAIASWINAGK